jgi:hypothetical protein
MHWTLRGAQLLLQTRTKVLNNELEQYFGPGIHCSESKRKPRDTRVPAALYVKRVALEQRPEK